MNLLIYKRFIKYARLQAVFLGGIGVALLLFPKFLLGSMFYVIVGYIILSGVLLIIDFIREKTTKSILNYGSLVLASLLIVFGCTSIVFSRYLVNVSPIYLDALLLIKAFIYFVIALCATTFWQKSILAIFASIALLGGDGCCYFYIWIWYWRYCRSYTSFRICLIAFVYIYTCSISNS